MSIAMQQASVVNIKWVIKRYIHANDHESLRNSRTILPPSLFFGIFDRQISSKFEIPPLSSNPSHFDLIYSKPDFSSIRK